MTKIADEAPAYCASCFQAGSEKHYIDFEAAYDGPVIPGSPANMPVDDLIICDECLETAFVLLDPKGQQLEIDRLEAHNTTLEREAASLRRQLSAAGVIRAERKRKVKA